MRPFVKIMKFNPNHDPHSGEFTSGNGSGGGVAGRKTVFHGTVAEYLKEIDEKGLVMNHGGGADDISTTGTHTPSGFERNSIWTDGDEQGAAGFARYHLNAEDGKYHPVILKIEIPEDALKEQGAFEKDPDFNTGLVAHRNIPRAWIKAVGSVSDDPDSEEIAWKDFTKKADAGGVKTVYAVVLCLPPAKKRDYARILRFDYPNPTSPEVAKQVSDLPKKSSKLKRQKPVSGVPAGAPNPPAAAYTNGQEGNVAGWPVDPLRYDGKPVPPESF